MVQINALPTSTFIIMTSSLKFYFLVSIVSQELLPHMYRIVKQNLRVQTAMDEQTCNLTEHPQYEEIKVTLCLVFALKFFQAWNNGCECDTLLYEICFGLILAQV